MCLRQLQFLWPLLFLTLTACVTADPTKDVELTWEEAYVRMPGLLPVVKEHRARQLAELPPGTTFPTLIYMHGSGGLWPGAYKDIAVAEKAGLAVIAINSYARDRPKNPGQNLASSCDNCWHIYREIFALRTAELAYTLQKVRHLPWA